MLKPFLPAACMATLIIGGGMSLGCDRTSPSSLTSGAPSPIQQPVPPPASVQLVTFRDPVSGLTTPDVRDVDDEIVQFNSVGELIWVADGTRFQGYPIVQGSYIKEDFSYQVRFGTKDGERRAYFAGHDWDVIYDVKVVDGQLIVTLTDRGVPGT